MIQFLPPLRQAPCIALLGVLLFHNSISFAQSTAITGTVYDASTKEALIGATILQKGTTTGTSSNADGTFLLQVSELPVDITVSYIGYETQALSLVNNQPLEVYLKVDAELVGEVVVVG